MSRENTAGMALLTSATNMLYWVSQVGDPPNIQAANNAILATFWLIATALALVWFLPAESEPPHA